MIEISPTHSMDECVQLPTRKFTLITDQPRQVTIDSSCIIPWNPVTIHDKPYLNQWMWIEIFHPEPQLIIARVKDCPTEDKYLKDGNKYCFSHLIQSYPYSRIRCATEGDYEILGYLVGNPVVHVVE
jgi:hypothetical protein